jgi:hypothetical protein
MAVECCPPAAISWEAAAATLAGVALFVFGLSPPDAVLAALSDFEPAVELPSVVGVALESAGLAPTEPKPPCCICASLNSTTSNSCAAGSVASNELAHPAQQSALVSKIAAAIRERIMERIRNR